MDQLNKIKEWLLSLDPDTIIGLLDVSSDEVIARFEDKTMISGMIKYDKS